MSLTVNVPMASGCCLTFFLQIQPQLSDNYEARKRDDWPMKTLTLTTCFFVTVMFSAIGVNACPAATGPNDWVERAISADKAVAQDAQQRLRDAGPQGLLALERHFAKEIQLHRSGASSDERWKQIAFALDRVGGQYDDYASGLYWYTDLEKAKVAARVSGKPILSLRLLGRLDEDLSCANSRFFRTTLYPNIEINQLLKQRFILHWQSVRPAPKVTIEFGDGRKLRRTITGNSIHYILDPEGRVVDALPGLYAAPSFVAELRQAGDAALQTLKNGDHDHTAHFRATHDRLVTAWDDDLAALHVRLPADQPLSEMALESRMNDNLWQQMARLHAGPSGPDTAVRELMARKLSARTAPRPASLLTPPVSFPSAKATAPFAPTKSMVEAHLLNAIDAFDERAALDTVKNNYMLRTRILTFLAAPGTGSWTLDRINDWVYARIFLTPRQDPWLGLAPDNVFSAIDDNGELR